MKAVLCPSRHGRRLIVGQPMPTHEQKLAEIAAGRKRLVAGLKRRFPDVKVLGIVDKSTVLVELPDDEPNLLAIIRSVLDCESGPAR